MHQLLPPFNVFLAEVWYRNKCSFKGTTRQTYNPEYDSLLRIAEYYWVVPSIRPTHKKCASPNALLCEAAPSQRLYHNFTGPRSPTAKLTHLPFEYKHRIEIELEWCHNIQLLKHKPNMR